VIRTLLPACLLDLGCNTDPHKPVVRLKLLQRFCAVVDESEAGALATTILCAETENRDLFLARLVEFGKLATELVLGDVGAAGMEDVAENR